MGFSGRFFRMMTRKRFALCTAAIAAFTLIFVGFFSSSNHCLSPVHYARQHACAPHRPHPWKTAEIGDSRLHKNASVAIVSASDGYLGHDATTAAARNKREYALRHGYECMLLTPEEIGDFGQGTRKLWAKIHAIRIVVKSQRYDYILFIDEDAVVVDMDISLAHAIALLDDTGSSMLIGDDVGARNTQLNTGVMFFRSNEWTLHMLTEALVFRDSAGWTTIPAHFIEDQAVISHLTGAWPPCAWSRPPPHPHEAYFREGVLEVDHCLINRIPFWHLPLYKIMTLGYNTYDAVDGAFIVHFAGAPIHEKSRLMLKAVAQAGRGAT